AVASGALAGISSDISLTVWRTPDELRAGLTSGAIDLSVVPTQAAANLYNRGMGLRLVNVMTNGLLYVLAREGVIGSLADLAGKSLAVPFPNDTPDFVMRAILAQAGLTESVTLSSPATPMEAAQMLLSGRIDAAVLSEPVATVALMRAQQAGVMLVRAIDLQAEWGGITGLGPIVPQAGLAVTQAFRANHGELIAPLQAALAAVTQAVLADPAAAARHASSPLEQPAPMLAASIPHTNLTATAASEARPALEAMFGLMMTADAAILGGQLPDDGFYVL
ncbi:MAG TPA: ABC transporter substrate-binding protein, partial [Paracoccus sp.]|nr:ABC transporter substrate-binding protein [Paracoccus sp. (in: a-proteobacteria)]